MANNIKGVNWEAIETEYVTTSITYSNLANRHRLKRKTVEQRGARGKWAEKRRRHKEAVADAAVKAEVTKRIEDIKDFNDVSLKVARALVNEVAAAITNARNSSKPMSSSALRAVAGAFESAQRAGRLALGITTQNNGLSAPDGGPIQSEAKVITQEELEQLSTAELEAYVGLCEKLGIASVQS